MRSNISPEPPRGVRASADVGSLLMTSPTARPTASPQCARARDKSANRLGFFACSAQCRRGRGQAAWGRSPCALGLPLDVSKTLETLVAGLGSVKAGPGRKAPRIPAAVVALAGSVDDDPRVSRAESGQRRTAFARGCGG